jgi:hypothetical protein
MKAFHTSLSANIQSFDFSKIGSCGGVQVGEGMYFSHSLPLCEVWAARLGTINFYEVEIDAKLIDAESFYSMSPEFIQWLDDSGLIDAEGYIKESVISEFENAEDAISILKSRYYRECSDFDGIDDQVADNIVIWNEAAIKGVIKL